MKQRLKSQRGASITYALLLFLVCAVLGGVVLAAGTASAGRMSRLAESDQRSSSVSSAARLLEGQFDGAKVKFVRTRVYEVEKTTPVSPAPSGTGYVYGEPSESTIEGSYRYPLYDPDSDPDGYRMIVTKDKDVPKEVPNGYSLANMNDLVQYLSYLLVFDSKDAASEDGWAQVYPAIEVPTDAEPYATYALTLDGRDDLAVDIDVYPHPIKTENTENRSFSLELVFKNHIKNGDTRTKPFKLKMVLTADTEKPAVQGEDDDAEEIPSVRRKTKETVMNPGSGMVETIEVTETKTTVITWRVLRLEVVGRGGAL